jgi:hypothetical protein
MKKRKMILKNPVEADRPDFTIKTVRRDPEGIYSSFYCHCEKRFVRHGNPDPA